VREAGGGVTSNIDSWAKPSFEPGARVEIAPYRNGRFFYSYAAWDGCRGVVVEPRGRKAGVDVGSSNPARSGEMDVPIEALKVLDSEAAA